MLETFQHTPGVFRVFLEWLVNNHNTDFCTVLCRTKRFFLHFFSTSQNLSTNQSIVGKFLLIFLELCRTVYNWLSERTVCGNTLKEVNYFAALCIVECCTLSCVLLEHAGDSPVTSGTCWGLSSVLLEHAIETLQCTSGICWRLSCVLLEHDKKSTKIFPRIPGVMQKRGELFFSTSWSLQERFSCTVKDDWIKGQVETHCVSSLPWWSKSRNTITFRWAEA